MGRMIILYEAEKKNKLKAFLKRDNGFTELPEHNVPKRRIVYAGLLSAFNFPIQVHEMVSHTLKQNESIFEVFAITGDHLDEENSKKVRDWICDNFQ